MSSDHIKHYLFQGCRVPCVLLKLGQQLIGHGLDFVLIAAFSGTLLTGAQATAGEGWQLQRLKQHMGIQGSSGHRAPQWGCGSEGRQQGCPLELMLTAQCMCLKDGNLAVRV